MDWEGDWKKKKGAQSCSKISRLTTSFGSEGEKSGMKPCEEGGCGTRRGIEITTGTRVDYGTGNDGIRF